MDRDTQFRELLGRVFDAAQDGLRDEIGPEEYERRRQDFVFHMTDVAGDAARFTELVNNPDRQDDKAATTFVIGFLYHVGPHLNAAGRLLLDEIKHPFAADLPAAPVATNGR
jgi:hypothetical protein